MRYSGFLFITFIMSVWLYRCYAQAKLVSFFGVFRTEVGNVI
jgi:hypothetical protein